MILGESLFTSVVAGWTAIALMLIFVGRGSFNLAMLPVFVFSTRDQVLGVAFAVLLGLLAGALPAISAMRLKITDALRRN
jgi:putative ABC transport system permease protein